jgi:enoyl-CoA hydratase
MDNLLLEIKDGMAIIAVNRPHSRNAFDSDTQEKFASAVESLFSTKYLRVVIIAGTGDTAFASGGDLKEMLNDLNPAAGERLNRVMGHALNRLTKLPVPVMAAVNGDAIGGGCEILTACDLRIATARARFRFAEVNMGLSTGWGGTARLVNMIGLSRALDLLLTGRTFDSEEALSYGFINRITNEDEQVLEAAIRWAKELIALPKQALASAKELAWASTELTLERHLSLESVHFTRLWLQPDHLEAMNAFAEKRSPLFNQHLNESPLDSVSNNDAEE